MVLPLSCWRMKMANCETVMFLRNMATTTDISRAAGDVACSGLYCQIRNHLRTEFPKYLGPDFDLSRASATA